MTGEERWRCSIVIRAYNEERHIGRLLEGISQQTIQPLEVLVVDSGSSDRTVSIATRHGAKALHIQPAEFTFGRSLNLGIAESHNPFIVIASAHIHPIYPDWLEHLLAPLADSQVALVYGKQRGNAHSLFSEQQVFAHWYSEISQPRQASPFCNNANAAIRRSLWEDHHYDESLTGLEDLEWARWAMQQGHAIAYSAEAEIIHVHQETPRGVYNRYRREAMAFKRLFPHERFNWGDFLRLSASNIANDLRQAARQGVLLKSLGSIAWFRVMQFWGTYQGYRHPGPLTQELRKTFYYPRQVHPTASISTRDVEPIHYNE